MRARLALILAVVSVTACATSKPPEAANPSSAAMQPGSAAPDGFVSLFNGRDLSGWKIPDGDNGHWKVVDGVIDYDAASEAKEKHLWSERDLGDFVLRVDWRIKETKGTYPIQEILPDGSVKLGDDGKPVITMLPNADSGIYVRGKDKAQINIWCWPVGSGEVWGYRTDKSVSPEVRAGVVPKVKADKPVGEWNTFEITMKGDRLTVVLNGQTVLDKAELPGLPARGPIALQHHGGLKKDGTWDGASALVQFRNIYVKEL